MADTQHHVRKQQVAQAAAVPDPAGQCPLCGKANGCAVNAGADPASCWCMQTPITPAARAQANALRPAGTPASQCICPACGGAIDATTD